MTGAEHEQNIEPASTRPEGRRWSRWAIGVVACVALYAALGFLVAPALVEYYLPKYAQQELKCKAHVGQVRINPFLLTLEAKDFKLEEANGDSIAGFGRLFVDLELKSLLR